MDFILNVVLFALLHLDISWYFTEFYDHQIMKSIFTAAQEELDWKLIKIKL